MTSLMTVSDADAIKERQRAAWAAGDYGVAAVKIRAAAVALVDAVATGSGERVLDVACGTGNVAVPAAEAGARVTGLDLTPSLLELARARAAEAGLGIDWVEGDAEALPFDDASFDVVLSAFGVMFAPRHDVAAAELARVVRPGGRLGVVAWTPEGAIGRTFQEMGRFAPPPPAQGPPPIAWGTEEHVRDLLGDAFELAFAKDLVRIEFASVQDAVEFNETKFGPMVMLRRALGDDRCAALHELVVGDARRHERPDGRVVIDAEYLRTTGARR